MSERNHSPSQNTVQKYLSGVEYPVRKPDLLRAAKENGALQDVLKLLEELPGDRFEIPAAVMQAFGDSP